MVAHSGFQPSPYHTQPPAFSSPLDKVINEAQSGPSSRVQLLQRAVTLTRNSSVKRPQQQQQQQQQQTEEAGSYVNGADSRDGRNNAGLSGYRQQSAYPSSSTSQNPRQARNDQQYSNYDESHGYQQRIGGGGHNQEQRYAYPHAPTNESRQEYDGTAPSSHSDTRTNSNFTPSSQGSQSVNTASKEKERSRYSISDQVQNQRAARLSQQQAFTNHPEQKKNELNAPLSNAFRDSIASNISFNSITGSEDRSSMMMLNNFGAGGSGNNSIDDDGQSSIYGFANDADRIAREVRGLALRRRPSMDTVRSSEFGEGGRWAQAWAGSDDGEDEEEDEMDLQAMRTRDMSTFDIESTGAQTGLGALGELGNLQGARAAMNGSGAESTSKNANQRQVLNTSHAQNMALPRVQDVTNAMHTVNLTSTHKPTLQDQSRFRHSSSQSPSAHQYGLHANPQSDLTRRDTIMSVSGEIGEVAESEQSPHKRNDSNATVSTLQGSEATSYSNNQHVKVWPPTPAVSERGTSTANHARVNRSDTLRASPGIGQMAMGQSATVEYASPPHEQQPSPQMNHKQSPAKPLSPSALLTQADHLGPSRAEQYGVLGNAVQSHSDSKPYAGYSDPNQHSFYAPPETFGKARQKAIADHDGRESMVSDLDVETLRLDGSSIAGGSRDEWDSRRGSTSTIGSVDTAILDEQRRRRSQMEQEEFDGQNKRTSTSTIRGQQTQGVYDNHRHPTLQQQSLHAPQGQNGVLMSGSGLLKRNVSHPSPTAEKGDPLVRGAPTPRRSNTLPEEQGLPPVNQMQSPRSNYATPNLSPAPWAKNSPAHSPLMQSGNLMSPSMRSTNLSTTSTLNSGAGKSTISTASNAGTGKRTSAPNQTAQSEAEKFLTLGISHHESGDLSRSAFYFERSAKIEGGCVVGMCMWGMALREGWGVRKDQKRGFEWISRAASKAGDLMGSSNGKTRNEAEIKAIRSELKLSVYELGKCFCYGWGVKQDRQMALEYFELAAKLGDSDAQAEAGALLAAGKGCKKDLKKAAMYYRMAEAQGYDTVGLSWIHKDKYDPVSVGKTKGGK